MVWKVKVPRSQGGLDRAEARRALALLTEGASLVGLRGLADGGKGARNVILPATDVDGVLDTASTWVAAGLNVYLNVNPVRCGTERPPGRGPLTSDIARRRWLFIDIDPRKASGFEKASATDAEKTGARTVAERVRGFLVTRKPPWPRPVLVDSGNGFYLLYRIDLPNDEDSRQLVADVLTHLAMLFDGDDGKIDAQCHDAPRIMKLPGTMARKGPSTPERPHRQSQIVDDPGNPGIVTAELLRSLVSPDDGEVVPPYSGFTVPIPHRKKPSLEDRVLSYLRTCPPAIEGQNGSGTAYWVARAVVYGFDLGAEAGYGILWDHYNPRCRPAWTESQLRHKCKDADEKPFSKPRGWLLGEEDPSFNPSDWEGSRDGKPPGSPPNVRWSFQYDGEILAEGDPAEVTADHGDDDEGETRVRVFELSTLRSIMARQYPEPNWIIPGILSEGLNLLAGAPKQGKSMLALNLALTIAGGGSSLGNKPVPASDVLYLSLEDKQRRIKDRGLKMLPAVDAAHQDEAGRRLTVTTDWPRQDQAGLKLIDLWAAKVKRPGLVIIDVWNRFAPQQQPRANAYSQDAEAMSEVKRFVEKRGITALIIHHTRKPGLKEPDDFVQEVSGTMGLSGTADGILVLVRSRQDKQAVLNVTGRDVSEQELVLEFDVASLTWKSLGTAGAHMEGKVQAKVIQYLRALGDVGAFCNDIAMAVSEKPDSVRKALGRLLVDRVVRKKGNSWVYPGDGEEIAF